MGRVVGPWLRFRDAVECYDRSLEAEPSQYAVQLAFGKICLSEFHDGEKAAAHLRNAAALSPDAEQRARLLSTVGSLAGSG